jgi:hypothetical protein
MSPAGVGEWGSVLVHILALREQSISTLILDLACKRGSLSEKIRRVNHPGCRFCESASDSA